MSNPDSSTTEDLSLGEKARAIRHILGYRPYLTLLIVLFGVVAALLEGIGLGFIVPIIEIAQNGTPSARPEGLVGTFYDLYLFAGVAFTLETVVLGVVLVMTVRYLTSFLMYWLREHLRAVYVQHLRLEAFDDALVTRTEFFDQRGSDDILNAIITQTYYAGQAIQRVVQAFEQVLLTVMYLGVAFYLAPLLTILSAVLLGGMTFLIRNVIEPGYVVGDRVADANERIQRAVQSGTQGVRAVKLFGLRSHVFERFSAAVANHTRAHITLTRNDALITNLHNWLSAITVFVLIYLALIVTPMSFGSLALFLFAMFRLAPRVSSLNQLFYKAEGLLPHVIRSQSFTADLKAEREPDAGTLAAPDRIDRIEFDDVEFAYSNSETILDGFSIDIDRHAFVAFVGQSGAGKSTVVSLLTRMYEPTAGEIRINGTPLVDYDLASWRSKIAVVRQDPFIFNETLRFNLTLGRDVPENELDRVCRIAKVDEFLHELPNGFDSALGDNGVQLSGGQRQRVALARALLKESAEILVLDEATSALDSDLEREVKENIDAMDRKYTVVAIAHRLSTVKNADCIYTLEDGRVVESGYHADLISSDGKYAQLYATQTTG